MICNLGDPMSLRHPVCINEHALPHIRIIQCHAQKICHSGITLYTSEDALPHIHKRQEPYHTYTSSHTQKTRALPHIHILTYTKEKSLTTHTHPHIHKRQEPYHTYTQVNTPYHTYTKSYTHQKSGMPFHHAVHMLIWGGYDGSIKL